MEKVLIFIGIGFILLQIYIEIHMKTDDKYVTKKSTDIIIKELKEKRKIEGKLGFMDSHNLKTRVFIHNRVILKLGAILFCIGIILKIII
ncbi:hypothetical protein [Sulfurimonas sp.]|uniref:hypothetical protein n=1 Tax=Sulfurimonas sp. TaxID=2022749 RepID=UPI00286E1733|nr:hypothetical protein [Sulfurimonas sp.]